MTSQKSRRRGLLRFVCILCVLSIVLVALPACDGGGGSSGGGLDSGTKSDIDDVARLFIKGLLATGRTAEQVMQLIKDEAVRHGPDANYFLERAIYWYNQLK